MIEYTQQQAEEFQRYKDTLPKEPTEPGVKKEYVIGCHSAEDWKYIHEVLMQDGTLEDNIPNRSCECVNDVRHSPIRGVYLLSEDEYEQLKNHPKVYYITINISAYPGTYAIDSLLFFTSKTDRYNSTVKHQREMSLSSGILPSNPGSDLLNRGGWQLKRHMQQDDPWFTGTSSNSSQILEDKISQYGTGKDVDVIVHDLDCWFGHIEFQNPSRISNIKQSDNSTSASTSGPQNYIGGNFLPGNGSCDLLDLVLEAPYYLDPDFFNTDWDDDDFSTLKPPTVDIRDTGATTDDRWTSIINAQISSSDTTKLFPEGSKTETRWDGTTVPKENWALAWWRYNTKLFRSSKFVSSSNGGTATGNNDFGEISILFIDLNSELVNGVLIFSNGTANTNRYTRAKNNGTNTAYATVNRPDDTHGTPVASLTYGRQYGWAYNANKWFIRFSGAASQSGPEYEHDIIKVFHQIKPNRASDDTKNPTIVNASYIINGNFNIPSSGYYYFRSGTSGSGGVSYTSRPEFINNFTESTVCFDPNNIGSFITSGNELIDAGVIFVCAAGNSNQKLVTPDHADYNNYTASADNSELGSIATKISIGGFYSALSTTNRPGWPHSIGSYNSDGTRNYKTIIVGCLEDTYASDKLYKESKAIYSNMGNAIDVFGAGDGTIAAKATNGTVNRYDAYYTSNGTESIESKDGLFAGTSAATPVVTGLIATKLEKNRNWTYSDVKSYLSGLGQISSDKFYYGVESTTANDSNWSDKFSLQGANGYILYDIETAGDVIPEPEPTSEPTPEPEPAGGVVALITGSSTIIGNGTITTTT